MLATDNKQIHNDRLLVVNSAVLLLRNNYIALKYLFKDNIAYVDRLVTIPMHIVPDVYAQEHTSPKLMEAEMLIVGAMYNIAKACNHYVKTYRTSTNSIVMKLYEAETNNAITRIEGTDHVACCLKILNTLLTYEKH